MGAEDGTLDGWGSGEEGLEIMDNLLMLLPITTPPLQSTISISGNPSPGSKLRLYNYYIG